MKVVLPKTLISALQKSVRDMDFALSDLSTGPNMASTHFKTPPIREANYL